MRRGLGLLLALLAARLPAALALPSTDSFGYTASAIAYAWTDISGTGNSVTAWSPSADDGSVLFNLPFNFRFYGAPYNKVSVSSNGYIQFGTQSSFYGTNCLSANQDPRNVAALYWMDLNPGAGGAVYTEVQGSAGSRVAIVQFQAVPRNVGGGTVTAQWRLYEADNHLEAAWASTAGSGSGVDAVAGLRSGFDCPNRDALPLSCLQAVLTDNLCIRFAYPASEPLCGTPTYTPSPSISPTHSVSPTFSASPSASPTFSVSPTATETPSITQTSTVSPSPSASPTATMTATVSPTHSDSPSPTSSGTPSPSFTASPTPVNSATGTPSASPTATASATRTPIVLTDAYGYRAVQAPLAWEDISGTGTAVTAWAGSVDDGSALVDLPAGWSFRYYGSDYTKVAISTNGYLQFGSSSSAFGHSCLAAGASPFGIVALYWMDLNPALGGTVLWQVLGSPGSRRLVIQFNGVKDAANTGTLTAQAALYEGSHALSLRYLSSSGVGAGAAASTGLRSLFDCPNRTGLSLSCDLAGLGDGVQWDVSYPLSEPACGTPTSTPTPSISPSATASPSASPTATPTPSISPSSTASPTVTATGTETPSATLSPSFSVSPTATPSATITQTPTQSPSFSVSPTATPTATITETATQSPTFSVSPTITETATQSPSFTVSPTYSVSPTITGTFTVSPTFSVSPTVTESFTASPSPSVTPTATQSGTVTQSSTASPSATHSPTATDSPTATPSGTPTQTPTATPSFSDSPTPTDSPSFTATPSATPTATPSATRTDSPTRTVTGTATPTLFPPASKPACLVLGQGGYTSSAAGLMDSPGGVAMDTRFTPFKLYVADTNHHRVLAWNDASGLSNGQAPDAVIGQASLSGVSADQGGAISAGGLHSPTGLAVDPFNGDLWVADSGNHRVLRFSSPIAVSNASASLVLGQGGSFSSGTANNGGLGASSFNDPTGLSFDSAGRLVVADSGDHRVLRFSSPGSVSSADAVWGQGGSFTTASANGGGGVSSAGFSSPTGVLYLSSTLWVADSGNHRVLRFSTAPLLSPTANLVLGQPDFSSNLPNQGFALPNDTRLFSPLGLSMDGANRLLVADSGNHRVVAYDPGYVNSASLVWGQSSLGIAQPGTAQDQLQGPRSVAAWSSLLLVADSANHRALVYGCSAGVQASTATSTRSPSPSITPTATPSGTPTQSPTVSPSFTVSETFSVSPTRTVTLTVTNTPSISPSFTPSPTLTVTPTRTQTLTFTPAQTATQTLTSPPTQTPYPRSNGPVLAWPNPARRSGGRACVGFAPAADVSVELYDRLGQPVAVLSGAQVSAASGFACWDLRNRAGDLVAPGRYYVRVLRDGEPQLGRLTIR